MDFMFNFYLSIKKAVNLLKFMRFTPGGWDCMFKYHSRCLAGIYSSQEAQLIEDLLQNLISISMNIWITEPANTKPHTSLHHEHARNTSTPLKNSSSNSTISRSKYWRMIFISLSAFSVSLRSLHLEKAARCCNVCGLILPVEAQGTLPRHCQALPTYQQPWETQLTLVKFNQFLRKKTVIIAYLLHTTML